MSTLSYLDYHSKNEAIGKFIELGNMDKIKFKKNIHASYYNQKSTKTISDLQKVLFYQETSCATKQTTLEELRKIYTNMSTCFAKETYLKLLKIASKKNDIKTLVSILSQKTHEKHNELLKILLNKMEEDYLCLVELLLDLGCTVSTEQTLNACSSDLHINYVRLFVKKNIKLSPTVKLNNEEKTEISNLDLAIAIMYRCKEITKYLIEDVKKIKNVEYYHLLMAYVEPEDYNINNIIENCIKCMNSDINFSKYENERYTLQMFNYLLNYVEDDRKNNYFEEGCMNSISTQILDGMIKKWDINLNKLDEMNETILHKVCRNFKVERYIFKLIFLLVDNKIDTDQKNIGNDTAFDILSYAPNFNEFIYSLVYLYEPDKNIEFIMICWSVVVKFLNLMKKSLMKISADCVKLSIIIYIL